MPTTRLIQRTFVTALCLFASLAIARDPDSGFENGSLRATFEGAFRVGAALSEDQILGREPGTLGLVERQFNALTAENSMKWEQIQPEEGVFTFEAADALVAFAAAHGMHLTGHTLLWHQQTPDWVFQDADGNPASREQLLQRLETHVKTVVGRYQGKVAAWDVVNEALNEDGSLRETPWLRIIGESYLPIVYGLVHEADPEATLLYNDYNMFMPEKRAGAVRLLRKLQEAGIPVGGVGLQGHYGLDNPARLEDMEDSILAFAELGLESHVTELDVTVLPFPDQASWGADLSVDLALNARFNPYADGLPEAVSSQHAERYADIFEILWRQREHVARVTFWGVHDGQSWKNHWPMRGRTDYPLVFDRDLQPKPAFDAILAVTKP